MKNKIRLIGLLALMIVALSLYSEEATICEDLKKNEGGQVSSVETARMLRGVERQKDSKTPMSIGNTPIECDENYDLNNANELILEAEKNPFKFSAFDKGYVTFVFDDLRHDLDLVASIFAEYGFPLGIATIPKNLDNSADGLSSETNGFTVGMKMKDVVDIVVSNGGEVLAHNSSPVITLENQYDYDFMYGYFVECKRILEDNGYNVRGIIRAGGSGAISGTEEIEKWLIGNYEYSNLGIAENYAQDRETLNQPVSDIKALIDDAVNNKKWVKFMGHTLDGSEINLSEDSLREILQYCVDTNVNVVTYAYIFDNFSSNASMENVE